jgi:hypothetical protein
MADIYSALQDYQHLLLAGAGIWAYFKWQAIRRETVDQLAKDQEEHRKLTTEVIKASLNNGISSKMREIIGEHEVRERANLSEEFARHNTDYHRRRR